MSSEVDKAREMLEMLQRFHTRNHLDAPFPLDAKELYEHAKAAAVLFEATSKFVPDATAAVAEVRISNLEAMNDNLRVNNEALRKSNATLAEALEKMANPQQVITHNNLSEPSR